MIFHSWAFRLIFVCEQGYVVSSPRAIIPFGRHTLPKTLALADEHNAFPAKLSADGCHPNPNTYFVMEVLLINLFNLHRKTISLAAVDVLLLKKVR